MDLEPLFESMFRGGLRPDGSREEIHCLGILLSPWRDRTRPRLADDPAPALLERLRDTGYDVRPASWAPPPDEEGSRVDAATGRTIAMHYVRITPLGDGVAEVETVTYRHWVAAGGSVQRYVNGPDGWVPHPDDDALCWEA